MGRTPQVIVTAHAAALAAGDLDAVAADYAEDAFLVTWSATSPRGIITDAVDTFVFGPDHIRLQTAVFRLETDG